jgi:hypothetical protein
MRHFHDVDRTDAETAPEQATLGGLVEVAEEDGRQAGSGTPDPGLHPQGHAGPVTRLRLLRGPEHLERQIA